MYTWQAKHIHKRQTQHKDYYRKGSVGGKKISDRGSQGAWRQDKLIDWPWSELELVVDSVELSHGKFVVEEELEIGLQILNMWFEDLMCVVVQWYLECDSYNSCVKIRCQETDRETLQRNSHRLGLLSSND
jgi:hypothetical protein